MAEAAHSPNCSCRKQIDDQQLLSHICSTCCAIAESLTYFASALTSRPGSITSMQSYPTTRSSLLEGSTLGEPSEEEGECHENDTQATSITEAVAKPRARSHSIPYTKTKTTFRLAHPPPVSIHRQHLQIRPKVLLQLQRVSKTVRPKPVLEVLPSVIFAPRLARRFPRTFKGKAGLGADDLVIVSSENYDTAEADTQEPDELFHDTRWEEREIVAAICQPSKDKVGCRGKAEICLNHGPTWTASKLANGSYEFISVDEHGLQTIARWVLRPPRQRTLPTQNHPRSPSLEERRFNFSVLNPNSRRHAVIATLDRQALDISDRYSNPLAGPKSPDASTPSTVLSATSDNNLERQEGHSPYLWHTDSRPGSVFDKHAQNSNRNSSYFPDFIPSTGAPIVMEEPLRTMIIVTGIWVAFQEGFSPNLGPGSPTYGQSNSGSKHQRRSQSLTVNISSEQSPSPAKSRFGNTQRAGTKLQQTTSSDGAPLKESPRLLNTPPRRSQSTGSAFMRRVTSRKNSTAKPDQLSTVSDLDGSGTEKCLGDGYSAERNAGLRRPTLGSLPKRATGSPMRGSRTSSYQSTLDSPLEPVISHGLDPTGEKPVSSKEAPRKPRRLEKLFKVSRRTGGGL